jgi:SAM-dependent methyltransferase
MDVTGDQPQHGFNHNYAYHRYLLRRVPPGCERALDAGCGTGLFATRLAQHARLVEAIDRAPEVITAARALSDAAPNVRYIEADLTRYELGSGHYGYIACIAAIHHMPFTPAIGKLRDALAPGGVLAIIGLYRQATMADYLPDLAAIPANMAANAIIKTRARRHGSSPAWQVNTAPVLGPQMTLPEIRHEARRLLPGAVIRRRLYWRYSLIYRQPSSKTG